ncbi:MAG: methyltransferase domain-containing protein [Planctomycetes bacterium]|nr:methyltransferase domain-containing protein [Planctomycetota bacterium]
MLGKVVRYLKWIRSINGRHRRMEIGRRFLPSLRRQYELDVMVGPIGYWRELQRYQIGALQRLGLQPGHRLLDIGCGPLQGGLAFVRYLDAGRYTGIDVKPSAIAAGWQQIERAGLQTKRPQLFVSDCFGRDELAGQQYDHVWCSQMLYHLDASQVDALFAQLAARLAPHGRFHGDIIGYPNEVTEHSHWGGFRFHLHTLDSLRQIAGRHDLTVRDLGPIEAFGYPQDIALRTNRLLEITRVSPA